MTSWLDFKEGDAVRVVERIEPSMYTKFQQGDIGFVESSCAGRVRVKYL